MGIILVALLHGLDSGVPWAQVTLNDSLNAYKQPDFYALDSQLIKKYPFIHFERNHFQFYTKESPTWSLLYQKFSKMLTQKNAKLNFYHIGGSHIQADLYTHDIRTYLQTTWSGLPGERGYVFPFSIGPTNNPANYSFSSKNVWKYYRNVSKEPVSLDLGLMGAALTCSDSSMQVGFRYGTTQVRPRFNKIRVFHNKGLFPFEFSLGKNDSLISKQVQNQVGGVTDIYLKTDIEAFDLNIWRTNSEKSELELYGFQLLSDEPGISYNSIGINGAALWNYLECKNFEEQLKESPPDFFAFSVGTNDANVPFSDFSPEKYKDNLEKMILKVLNTNPNCAILLTVPNDSYYHRSSLNKNVARQREVIIQLAQTYQCAVWDLYGIMGELGSSKIWYRSKLMRDDLVHFTALGYHLKGDLYFDAFLKWLEQMDLIARNNN